MTPDEGFAIVLAQNAAEVLTDARRRRADGLSAIDAAAAALEAAHPRAVIAASTIAFAASIDAAEPTPDQPTIH